MFWVIVCTVLAAAGLFAAGWALFGWCVLPLAFIRCIVSNCRYYKLAARFGL